MQTIILRNIYSFTTKAVVGMLIVIVAFSMNIAILTNHMALASTGAVLATAKVDPKIDEEILWFARTIYSETKKPEEQTLVAWVIRNRVESPLYPSSYKDVVLQRGQFSGMHATDKQYTINVSLGYGDTSDSWDGALSIARAVYFADPVLRPIGKNVTHFYSPVSVGYTPTWAKGITPAHVVRDSSSNSVRFAFYADIM